MRYFVTGHEMLLYLSGDCLRSMRKSVVSSFQISRAKRKR